MWLSVVLLASLDRGTLFVEHPEISMKVPAIFGKPATPTPPGVYELRKGFSTQLNMRLLIFRREGQDVYAIHPNLPGRAKQIRDPDVSKKFLSGGCIGLEQEAFDKIWNIKRQTLILQVY
jgi:hypothetical protein